MPRDSFIQVTVSSSGKPREVNIWGISASVDAAVQLGRWEHQHQCIFFTCLSYFGSLCVHMKLTSLVEETWSPVNEKEVVENKVSSLVIRTNLLPLSSSSNLDLFACLEFPPRSLLVRNGIGSLSLHASGASLVWNCESVLEKREGGAAEPET